MQNLIKNRAATSKKLKKPTPKLPPAGHRSGESDSDNESIAPTTTTTTTKTTSDATVANALQLNVNASDFVPRTKTNKESKNASLCELKRHFESLDERKPKLLLPWKSFPKPMRAERPNTAPFVKEAKFAKTLDEIKTGSSCKRALTDKETMTLTTRKKQLKEKISTKDSEADELKRERERKVALEALKLVEQRRMRETIDDVKPQIIVHLTRTPVDFTPEERERVDRLRAIKKQHIERVLREMRKEFEAKQPKTQQLQSTGRYVGLQRSVKTVAEPNTKINLEIKAEVQPEVQPKVPKEVNSDVEKPPPRRYIPTAKEWNERCKAKANEKAANKENTMVRKPPVQSEEHASMKRVMAPSNLGNIMTSVSNISNIISKNPKEQVLGPAKERELFVPRYWPPAPLVALDEKRRGNLTHARNISRAFANCGLLPTPMLSDPEDTNDLTDQFYDLSIETNSTKPVKRYGMEELLELEPQPHELQKPLIKETLCKLGFISE